MSIKRLRNIKDLSVKLEFQDPDTGYQYTASYPNFQNLIQHIRSYRKINGLRTIKDLELLVEMYLCELPDNARHVKVLEKPIPLTLEQYVVGAKALLNVVRAKCTGNECFVSKEEADRRAEICFKCPYNTNGVKDPGMLERVLRKISSFVKPGEYANRSEHLGICTLCGCGLATKVWYAREMFEKDLKESVRIRLPDNNIRNAEGKLFKCWQVKDEAK